jgi:hypothetical protein
MSMTKGQARAWQKGMTATIEREKDKQTLFVKVEYPPRVREDQITDAMLHALFVRCGLDQATSRVEVARDLPDYRQLLKEKEDALKLEKARSEQMAEELNRLKTMIAAQSGAVSEKAGRWLTVREAAQAKRVSEMTIYRAIEDGRMTSRSKLVNKKRRHEVNIDTYVPKPRKTPKRGKNLNKSTD